MMTKTRVFGPGSSRARRGRVGHPSAPRDSSARARTSVASSSVSVMAKGLGVPSARGALPGGASVARSPEVSWSLVHYREQSERLGTPRKPRRSFDNDAPLLLSVCRSRRARSGCVPRALGAPRAVLGARRASPRCVVRAAARAGASTSSKSLLLDSDVGTQGTKSILFDLDAHTVAGRGSYAYDLFPHPSRPNAAEQDPETWMDGIRDTLKQALREANAGRLLDRLGGGFGAATRHGRAGRRRRRRAPREALVRTRSPPRRLRR